jgi:signal transduction histidine kinase
MKEALNVELEQVVSVMEQGGASMLLLSQSGEVAMVNKQFADIFAENTHIRLSQGINLMEQLKNDHHDMPLAWVGLFMKGLAGQETSSVLFFKKASAHYYWDIHFRPITSNEGKKFITVFTRDITRQKKAESKLITQSKELKKISAELDRFVYSASHDLRSPLMSIKGIVNILKTEVYNKESFDSYVVYIEKSIDKLENFISEIIDYSKNSRLEVKLQPIDFNELIDSALCKVQDVKGFRQVKVKIDVNAAQPFLSDYERLMVLFVNIITNSLLFRDPFKESFLKISVFAEQERVLIKFEDNGVGIADKYLDKVFQMFFRGNTESKGSGLGLYIVKEIVGKLKGTVSLESKLGIGTVLFIELPDFTNAVEPPSLIDASMN